MEGEPNKTFQRDALGYGGFRVKNESETCYGQQTHEWASTEKNSYMKDAIERRFGNSLSVKVKEDIYITFQQYMKDEGPSTCSKVKELILQTLKIVTSANSDSEKTVKLDSSNEYISANANIDSETTVKVNSNEEYDHDDIISRKKRRLGDQIERLTHEEPQTSIIKGKNLSQQSCGSEGTHSKAQHNMVVDEQGPQLAPIATTFEASKTIEDLQPTTQAILQEDNYTHSKTVTTASFDYMLCPQKFESTSYQQQEQGVTISTPSFCGFKNNTSTQKEPTSDQFPESKMSIDINKVFVPDEELAHTQTTQTSFARYLDEARKNYFFYSDDIPTLRLFKNHDDCGNEIKEPELWRPLHMDSEEYERKIEAPKRDGPPKKNIEVDNMMSKDPEQSYKSIKHSQYEINSTPNEFPVCCAQQQSQSYFCKTPRPSTATTTDASIIDLTSPNAYKIFQWNQEQTCYSPKNKNSSFFSPSTSHERNIGSPNQLIIPRRLFPDKSNHTYTPDGTEEQPIAIRDSQSASPKVQILGEKSLKQNCLNLLGNSDEHYNTRLLLGSSNSSVGKENVPNKRILKPSKYLCSPYDGYNRGEILSHELDLYNNIMILSSHADYKGVSLEQLGKSFKEEGWVESYVINVFCRKLFRDNHPRLSQRHFFFHTASEYFLQKWKNEASRLQWRDKLIKSFTGAGKAKDLQQCNELFFPTLHKSH